MVGKGGGKGVSVMLRHYVLREQKLVLADGDPATSQVLVYVNPDEEEKRFLVTTYKLDEHTLQSALDPDELSRLEFEPEHVAIIYKRPKNYSGAEQFLFRVIAAGLFWFRERLIIVVSEEIPLFDTRHFARLTSLNDLLLKILNRSVVHYLEHLRIINMISEQLENKLDRAMENRYLISLYMLEKSLVYYVNAITSNQMVLDKLKMNAGKLGLTTDEQEILDDLMIENHQCAKQAEIHSNVLAGLLSTRASIISNNLNVLMKNLNAVVIAIMVPSFIAGIGGMSEFTMMTGEHNWPLAYMGFICVNILIAVYTYILIRRWEHRR